MEKTLRVNNEAAYNFELIRDRYVTDYVPFYKSLAGHYIGNQEMTTYITDSRRKVEDVIKQLNFVLNPKNKILPKKIDELSKAIDTVDFHFNDLQHRSWEDTDLANKVKAVEEKSGRGFDELQKSQQVMKGRIGKLTKDPSLLKKATEFSPETLDYLKGVGKSALSSTFKPFEPLAKGIGGIVGGIAQRRRERRVSAQEESFAQAVTPSGATPKDYAKIYGTLASTGRAKVEEDVSRYGRVQSTAPGGGVGGVSVETLTMAMTAFFAGPAYRTKWTAELLESIQGKKAGGLSTGGATGKGLFSSLIDAFKGMVPAIAGIIIGIGKFMPLISRGLAVAGAAVAGWAVGRFLGENVKWGGKTLDEHVQGGFVKMMGGDKKTAQEKSLKQDISVERQKSSKRIMELQAQGLSPAEVQKRIHDEGLLPPTVPAKSAVQASSQVIPATASVVDQVTSGATNATPTSTYATTTVNKSSSSTVVNKGGGASSGGSSNREAVPVSTGMESLVQYQQKNSDRLIEVMTDLTTEVKKIGGNNQNFTSNDAWDSKNPLLSMANTAMVDIG